MILASHTHTYININHPLQMVDTDITTLWDGIYLQHRKWLHSSDIIMGCEYTEESCPIQTCSLCYAKGGSTQREKAYNIMWDTSDC